MVQKKLSEKTYKILETEGAHTVDSKETSGATRALEFEDGTNNLLGPVELVEVKKQVPKTYEEFSPMGQLVIDMADIIVTRMTDYLTEKAISSFDNWLRNRKKQHNRVEKKKSESILTCKTRAQQILEIKQTQQTGVTSSKEKANQTPFVEFDNAYKEYRIYMTSEEVQKELIDIFMLSVIRAKKIWKVSHANVVDVQTVSKELLEGQVLIEKLCNQEVLDSVNDLLGKKPALLEEWESIALSDILGRSLFKDGQYVPIESRNFGNALRRTI